VVEVIFQVVAALVDLELVQVCLLFLAQLT